MKKHENYWLQNGASVLRIKEIKLKQVLPKYVLIFFLLSVIGCNKVRNTDPTIVIKHDKITSADKSVIDSLGIDQDILILIRNFTDASITPLQRSFNIYSDSLKTVETIVKNHTGFSFNAEQNEARDIVLQLKGQLKAKGYLIYISAIHFGYEPDQVTVLKGMDQFDILRIEETDAINYGLENGDVIAKLKEWDKAHHFEIIAADISRVEAIFIDQPKDLKAFSEELYEFCPDIVDQGTGTVKELELELKRYGILYLWWD